MARTGTVSQKIKRILRRWHSSSSSGRITTTPACDAPDQEASRRGLHPVYVGKSRRRYLVAAELADHPLFRGLVDSDVVACEVVLFDHLLWMLEHADPQPESLDELLHYYACS